jgi:hypothetical protein
MARQRRHLSAGALEALRDGEGPGWARLLARGHLLVCAECRQRREAGRAESERVAVLLKVAMLPAGDRWPDLSDAWERFVIRSGVGAAVAGRRLFTGRLATRNVIGGALIAAGLVAVGIAIDRAPRADLVTRMYSLSAQDRITPKGPSSRDVEFARSIATLEATGKLRRLSDVCCADRDGEGPADDGVLTVRLAGSRSPVVILYEDTQRARTFKSGDAVLMVSRPGLSAEELPAGANGLPSELRE